jgi:hypothetical protein
LRHSEDHTPSLPWFLLKRKKKKEIYVSTREKEDINILSKVGITLG